MSDAIIEAYELARFAEQLAVRLADAQAQLADPASHRQERGWLETAENMVNEVVEPLRPQLARARLLPELSFLRDEVADECLNAWVDSLEKLLAGITFHAGSRAPVLEALFPPKMKLPALRRATRDAASAFNNELERRLKGSYVTRMFGQEDMQFVHPVVESIRQAFSQYVAVFDGTAMQDDEAEQLRSSITGAAQRLELLTQQAKLLAQAALLPVEGAFEAVGLNLKPKKRAVRTADVKPELAEDEALGEEVEESVPAEEPIQAEAAEEPAESPETEAKPARTRKPKAPKPPEAEV